ncbi:MAG: hypothetical protein KKC11_03440, partial [Candidatus Omnitrophica bacterium]|nr:hypothetical protein [Candidatus Omnitrophota bacterium]
YGIIQKTSNKSIQLTLIAGSFWGLSRRNTNRIPQHNYSTPGQYFLTICIENRQQIFGTVENDK